MTQTETPPSTFGADELLERVRTILPAVCERIPQAEGLRMLPPETLQDFVEAGLIRACVPKRYGGLGLEPTAIVRATVEVARTHGSSGWMASFYPLHNWMIGWFPDEAQAEYWANGPNTISSTVPAFRDIERTEEKGGVRISGSWGFSSGVDHDEWAIVHTPVEVCLVPRSDFEVIDDWYVAGLRATGSKTVKIDGAFVPSYRTVANKALETATPPGLAVNGDDPFYRVIQPAVNVLNHFILAPQIGMARGVLDLFDKRVRKRFDPLSLQPALERPGPQLRFAEASAEIDVAEILMWRNLDTVREWGVDGTSPTLEQRAEIRRNIAYAAKIALRATNRLVDGMDSSGLKDENMIVRQAADTRAAGLQFVLHWEETAMQYSRVHWGLDPQTILI